MKETFKLNIGSGDAIAKEILNASDLRILFNVLLSLLIAFLPGFISILEGNFNNSKINIDFIHDYGYLDLYFWSTHNYLINFHIF